MAPVDIMHYVACISMNHNVDVLKDCLEILTSAVTYLGQWSMNQYHVVRILVESIPSVENEETHYLAFV